MVYIADSEEVCQNTQDGQMLIEGVEMFKVNTQLVKLILQILRSALRISQKRKVYQPHSTLSVESLLHLCEVVDESCDERQSLVAQIGLEAVLMSTPPPSSNPLSSITDYGRGGADFLALHPSCSDNDPFF
ncbi:hypothetical protein RND71_034178 [Anisodus tanguticus]|uniref:Uncharacterized protein n=1 Tax=Anisodus tanguticus TaxID=243964 RepID=A0AAE1RAT0_9SOLA|nr:hypothetical protein RND71_034178 [Anisodus tanguticus]